MLAGIVPVAMSQRLRVKSWWVALQLRSEKNLAAVRVFHFRAAGETADIDVTGFRRVGAGNETGLVRDRDRVRDVAFRILYWRRGRGADWRLGRGRGWSRR